VAFYDVAEKNHKHLTSDITYFREDLNEALTTMVAAGKDTSYIYTAAGGETVVNSTDSSEAVNYDVGFVAVFKNGLKLIPNTDFTASDGKQITNLTPLTTNDVIEVVAYAKGIYYDDQLTSTTYTASGGETVVTHTYSVGYLDVYKNGIKLVPTEDFTANNGTSVTFSNALIASDTVEFVSIPVSVSYKQNEKTSVFYTASGGETSVTTTDSGADVAYQVGYVDVFKNGIKIIESEDYSASTGTSISLVTTLQSGDVIELVYLPSVFFYDVASKNHTHTVAGLADVDLSNLEDGSAIVYNASTQKWEVGIAGGAVEEVFYENKTTLSTDYTITSGYNAMTAGPITIDDGVTVTVPDGSVWTIV